MKAKVKNATTSDFSSSSVFFLFHTQIFFKRTSDRFPLLFYTELYEKKQWSITAEHCKLSLQGCK